VYYPYGLILSSPSLTIRMGGFWLFKWLKIDGVAPAAACAF
jgi:hypothetical protein